MWFVALQPGQEQPCGCFDHADNIVHMGKTIAQKGAQGIRMSMLLLLGISPKLILLFVVCFFTFIVLLLRRGLVDSIPWSGRTPSSRTQGKDVPRCATSGY